MMGWIAECTMTSAHRGAATGIELELHRSALVGVVAIAHKRAGARQTVE
jgi:hypothetical protein